MLLYLQIHWLFFIFFLHSVVEPIHWVFYFIFCTFNSKISIWFFFIHLFVETSYLFVIFLFFYICFKNTCNCLLKYFYDSCFNSLVFWTSLLSRCWHLLIAFSHSSWYSSGSWYNKICSHLGYCIIGLWVLNLLFWLASYDTTQKG